MIKFLNPKEWRKKKHIESKEIPKTIHINNNKIKIDGSIPYMNNSQLKSINVINDLNKTIMSNNNIRYFQWLTFDKQGQIMIYDRIEEEDGIIYVVFKDGSRCNEALIAELNSTMIEGKLMAEIESTSNIWTFKTEVVGREEERWEENAEGEKVCVQPLVPGKKKVIPIPPRPTKSRFGDIKQSVEQGPIQHSEPQKPVENLNDPVYLLCAQSKKKETDINLVITLALPDKNLYNVVKTSFEKGDEKVCEYIINNLDMSYLKDRLKLALKEMYNLEENNTITND